MLREVLRSTLYSSSRPFSSKATRRSSFSTLLTILLPVLGDDRRKIFRTLSNIKLKCWRDRKRNGYAITVHRWRSIVIVKAAGEPAAVAGLAVDASPQRVFEKSSALAAAGPRAEHEPPAFSRSPCLARPLHVRHRATSCRSPIARRRFGWYRRLLRPRRRR